MKIILKSAAFFLVNLICFQLSAQTGSKTTPAKSVTKKHLFIDVHQLEPGKVNWHTILSPGVRSYSVSKRNPVVLMFLE